MGAGGAMGVGRYKAPTPHQRFGKTKTPKNKTNHATKANQNALSLGKADNRVKFSNIIPINANTIEATTSQTLGGCNVMTALHLLGA
jgi:hypothetical protein